MSQSPFDLSGRVAVVTGGSRGIGFGIAQALAAAGAAVAVWGRDTDRNRQAVQRLAGNGATALAVTCDVSDEQQVERAMRTTVDTLGTVDVCVANAGTPSRRHPIQDFPTEEWHRVLAVNLDGCFFTLRAAARHMIEQGTEGSLIAVSSVAALHGQPSGPPYSAAKAAMLGLTRSFTVAFARHGIRANAVLPGWIDTDMTSDIAHATDPKSESVRQAVERRIPARRWGDPTDLGGVAVYLASDASAYHTGDVLVVDGGYTVS